MNANPSKRPSGQQIDIETEHLQDRSRLILALTWPALAENILSTLVSMADTIMVGALGAKAIAAVGLVTQPRFIMLSAFMALGVGTTALVARAKGKGDQPEATHALKQSLVLSVGILAIICTAMFIWMRPLIGFIAGKNIDAESIEMACDYFRLQIYGFPCLGLTFMMNAALRGAGNTRAAFYSNTAANIVNVILNYLLIYETRDVTWFGHTFRMFGAGMGVTGASLATVIGQSVAFLFALYLLLNGKQYVCLRHSGSFRPDFSMIRRIGRIGMPAMIEQLIMRVGMMLFTLITTSLGDTPYATHIIAMNIQSMSFTTGMSFGTAATTLTGQCLGRKRPDLAKWYVRRTLHFNLAVSLLVAAVLFFFGGDLARLYNKEEAEIIAMAAMVLKIIAVANPMSNSRFIYNSALRGAGDARFTAISTFLGIVLIRPAVAGLLVYVFNYGLLGVWIALVSDALICYILAIWRWRSEKWASIVV